VTDALTFDSFAGCDTDAFRDGTAVSGYPTGPFMTPLPPDTGEIDSRADMAWPRYIDLFTRDESPLDGAGAWHHVTPWCTDWTASSLWSQAYLLGDPGAGDAKAAGACVGKRWLASNDHKAVVDIGAAPTAPDPVMTGDMEFRLHVRSRDPSIAWNAVNTAAALPVGFAGVLRTSAAGVHTLRLESVTDGARSLIASAAAAANTGLLTLSISDTTLTLTLDADTVQASIAAAPFWNATASGRYAGFSAYRPSSHVYAYWRVAPFAATIYLDHDPW